MPTSYQLYKDSIKNWILENVSLDAKILDIGAGCGTYSNLLRDYGYKMDAIEIWEPYIKKYNLKDKYDVVMEMDVLDVYAPTLQNYDMCILGDILEHLNIEDGQRLIKDISKHCKYFIVSPSTFSWWGAWLSKRKGKICVRPKNLNVSNNKDFWPKDWKSIL